jgi:hypothetical protein
MVLRRLVAGLALVGLAAACRPVRVHLSPETPFPPADPACLTELVASDNYQVLTRTFTLREETPVRIVGQSEGTSFELVPGFVEAYLNDCIEFFIDLGTVCRQYRFVWDSERVTGNNIEMDGVRFAQGDPSRTRYVFELSFPWKTLGFRGTPKDKDVLRMDVSAIDNDGQSRKSQIAWSGVNAELFMDWSQFGDFPLAGHRTAAAPVIDGEEDAVWQGQERFPIAHVIIGAVVDETDLSGWYRLLWDRENLYLLVEIEDDVKRQAAFMFDNGSLEDADGTTLWQLEFDRTVHAGGALKNRRQEDTLRLPAGKYTLRFETDECHATGHWDDVPPTEPFSGIKLYALDK